MNFFSPSYLCIIPIFISKSMVVHLQDGLLYALGAYLPPEMAQNMEILDWKRNCRKQSWSGLKLCCQLDVGCIGNHEEP
jgi:hypothetical protein